MAATAEKWDRPVTVNLSKAQFDELEQRARQHYTSTSALIRAAVARFLETNS